MKPHLREMANIDEYKEWLENLRDVSYCNLRMMNWSPGLP